MGAVKDEPRDVLARHPRQRLGKQILDPAHFIIIVIVTPPKH